MHYHSLSAYMSLREPGLLFRASLEITSLSPYFRGTGGYCSAPDVPLKSPFVRSIFAKGLIVSCYHDKTSRYSRVFLTTVFVLFLRLGVSFVFFCQKSPFLPFSEKDRSESKFRKLKVPEYSDPPFY